jgi:hypothetical protein
MPGWSNILTYIRDTNKVVCLKYVPSLKLVYCTDNEVLSRNGFRVFLESVLVKKLQVPFGLCLSVLTRVTRLGEFSPNGWLLSLASFPQIIEVACIFGILCFTVKVVH